MIKHLLKHAFTAVVAVAVVGPALADGGYGLTARGIIAVAAWWAIILGLGLSLLPFRRPSREAYLSGGLLAGLGLLALLSIAWSASPERSFIEFDRVALYLGIFILAVLASTRSNIGCWTDGLAIGIAFVGLLALTSRLFPGFVPGSEEVTSIANARARLAFPFGYWNALGMLLALGFPLLLRSAVLARRTAAQGLSVGVIPALSAAIFLTSSRGAIGAALIGVAAFVAIARPRPRAVWAALCAVAGSAVSIAAVTTHDALMDSPLRDPALTAAQGRGLAIVTLAVCVGSGAVYLAGVTVGRSRMSALPNLRLGRWGRLGLGGLAAAAVVAAIIAVDLGQLYEGFKQSGFGKGGRQGTASHLLSATGGGRYQFWSAAVDEFQAHPILGGGAGSYEFWWASNPGFPYFVRDAHSLWLETLGELGLVGLFLLVGAFGLGLANALRRARGREGRERVTIAALSATLLAWGFAAAIDWMWEMTVVSAVAVACLALLTGPATAAPSSGPESGEAPARRRRGSRSFGVGVAVIAAAWLVICAQASPLLSEIRIEDSRAAVARGDLISAARDARGARTLQPWASSPYRQLALVEEERGRLDAARADIGEAIEREPGRFELWDIAARIERSAGDSARARRSLERSRRLNPRRSTTVTVTP